MRKRIMILTLICMACFLGLVNPAEAATRTALVIGNSNYKSAPLRNPVNDARDMAKTLRDLNFDVIERLNASKKDMVLAINEFYKRLKRADVGVFYFAGHGMQIQGVNYLIPVKAQVTSETDVQFEAVDAGRVLGKMRTAGNKLNIVILDACRDNPFKRSFRTESKGLAQMDAPKGTIIAYATSPGSVAADGTGRNGVYTKHLLKSLTRSGMTVYDVFRETGLRVMRETREEQIPWISSTPVQRYYMVGRGSGGNDAERRRLEKERRELERLRAEIERKRQEIDKQKVETASLPQKPSYTRPSSTVNMQVRVSHILIKESEKEDALKKIKEVQERYKKGHDFAKLANLYSQCPSYARGGELGYFKRGQLVPAFEEVAFKLKPGEVSDIVRTRYGYHLIKVIDKKSESTVAYEEIAERDGIYVALANGIVKDTKTGLEWKVGPDRDTIWNEARSWVQSLNRDGGGWRMPSTDELYTLYNKGAGDRNMTPLLKITGWYVWSGETEGPDGAKSFTFDDGYSRYYSRGGSYGSRALAVRSRGDR